MSQELPNGTAVLVLIEDPTTPGTYIPLEAQGDLSISESSASIDTSSKDARERAVTSGRYESSGSVALLYRPSAPAQAALKASFRAGTLITLRVSEDGEQVEEAQVHITQHNLDAPDQDRAEISIEFDVNGAWELVGS